MKRLLLSVLFLMTFYFSWSCPVCEKQQPKILQGITHGTGPQSNWDYLIIWSMVFIVAATLWYSIQWLIQPGEKQSDHIKNNILN